MKWTIASCCNCRFRRKSTFDDVEANRRRIDNGDKLSEKVQEALAVYDEYVKNSGGEVQDGDGNADDAGKEGEPEAAKT